MSYPRLFHSEAAPIEAEILDAGVPLAGIVPDIVHLLQLASSAVDLISRDRAAARQPRLKPALDGARSCLDQAAAIVRGGPVTSLYGRLGTFDVADLLRSMRPLLRMICRTGHRLTLTMSPSLPTVSGDALALEAVLQSLVTYACRENPGGGDIVVHAAGIAGRHGEPGLLVTVRCHRQSDGRDGIERGHGRDRIGLSMAMRFVQAKGGELHVDRPDGDQLVIMMQVPALRPRPS